MAGHNYNCKDNTWVRFNFSSWILLKFFWNRSFELCRNKAMLKFLEQVKMARAQDEEGMVVFYSMFSVAFWMTKLEHFDNFFVAMIVQGNFCIWTYGSISLGQGKWSNCGIFFFFGALLWPNGLIFSTVLKRFCPWHSKNVFLLVLAHLEPELELFEVWEIVVLQIIITIIANVINFKQLLLGF